jgi:hypothetical protein
MTDKATRRVTVVPRPAVTTTTPPAEPAATPEDHEEATRANKPASGRKKE